MTEYFEALAELLEVLAERRTELCANCPEAIATVRRRFEQRSRPFPASLRADAYQRPVRPGAA